MDDTSPEMAAKVRELMQTKTPEERLQMSWSMHYLSKKLITNAILRDNPTISEADLKKEIFLRFYGDDFGEEEKQRILAQFDRVY